MIYLVYVEGICKGIVLNDSVTLIWLVLHLQKRISNTK